MLSPSRLLMIFFLLHTSSSQANFSHTLTILNASQPNQKILLELNKSAQAKTYNVTFINPKNNNLRIYETTEKNLKKNVQAASLHEAGWFGATSEWADIVFGQKTENGTLLFGLGFYVATVAVPLVIDIVMAAPRLLKHRHYSKHARLLKFQFLSKIESLSRQNMNNVIEVKKNEFDNIVYLVDQTALKINRED